MLSQVMEVLQAFNLLAAIQFIAITIAVIYIFRYFTDRS